MSPLSFGFFLLSSNAHSLTVTVMHWDCWSASNLIGKTALDFRLSAVVQPPGRFLQVSICSIDIDAIISQSETDLNATSACVSFSLDTSAQFHYLLPQFL